MTSPGPPPGSTADEVAEAINEVFPSLVRVVLARQERRRRGETLPERVTAPQQLTLSVLREGPMAVSEVAAATGVALSSATRMLQGLERLGLVTRLETGEDADRRRRYLALSEEGARVLDASVRLRFERLRAIMEHLDPSERDALLTGLRAFIGATLALDRDGGPDGAETTAG